ncbi:hypothetical protein Q8F55_001656 [Vanrija albida]|uniref:Major facilitator superfamily (MFS) profile domain-containing protein n=1 Tax=Vanrija albida TaxID=181172 RepID=A0ABR3Q7K7_9TREE
MASLPYSDKTKEADYLDAEVTHGGGAVAGTGAATPDSKHSLDEDTPIVDFYDLPLEERRKERKFLWKLDLVYVTVAMVAFVFKIVDQNNIANAYVSGMKEEIGIKGNEYNWFTTYFNIGYIIVLYPSQIAITHWGAHWWLPACELLWGVLTCVLSIVQNSQTVFGIRFLIGLAEGTAWPGNTTLIAQWYLPHEVATRLAIFNLAQPIGGMISGIMQAALSTHLDGVHGRSGWRWAFIVNGVCTIFIALVAFVCQPGMPDRPNPLARWYLTDEDYAIARRRVARVKRKAHKPLTVKAFFGAFKYWQLWAIALCWAYGYNTVPSNFFNLWLKSLTKAPGVKKYSVAMLNYLTVAGQSVSLVSLVLLLGLSDYLGVRLPSLALHTIINVFSLVVLIIRPKNEKLHMAGYMFNYAGLPGYLLPCAWAATYLGHVPDVRAVLFATGTVISYINVAFIPLWAYPTSQAPNWKVGAKFYLGSMLVTAVGFVATAWGLRWEERKRLRKEGKDVPKPKWYAFLWT